MDGESFELLNVLNTKDIYGWHTLTYLAFDPGLRTVPMASGVDSHVVCAASAHLCHLFLSGY